MASIWTCDQCVDQVIELLKANYKPIFNYDKLTDLLTHNDVDGEVLLSLEDSDLQAMGVESVGQRREIMKLIKALQGDDRKSAQIDLPAPIREIPTTTKKRLDLMQLQTTSLEDLAEEGEDSDVESVLSEHWMGLLERYPEEDGEGLRPYAESDQELELDPIKDKELLDELEEGNDDELGPLPITTTQHCSKDEVNKIISAAITKYTQVWQDTQQRKKYKMANKRWMHAFKAGTRRPQQYEIGQTIERLDRRLQKLTASFYDVHFTNAEEVSKLCKTLEGTVEDIAKQRYFLTVLESSTPPVEPPADVTHARQNPDVSDEIESDVDDEEDAASTTPEKSQDSYDEDDDVEMLNEAAYDDREIEIPYELSDSEWQPEIPQETQVHILEDTSATSERYLTPEEDITAEELPSLAEPSSRPSVLLECSFDASRQSSSQPAVGELHELQCNSQQLMPEGLPEPEHDPTKPVSDELPELEYNSDFDGPVSLPQSRYRHQGTSLEAAIRLDSSPARSSFGIHTPPLNAQSPNASLPPTTSPLSMQFPDIVTTRRMPWDRVDSDTMSLAKTLFSLDRANCTDLATYVNGTRDSEAVEAMQIILTGSQPSKRGRKQYRGIDQGWVYEAECLTMTYAGTVLHRSFGLDLQNLNHKEKQFLCNNLDRYDFITFRRELLALIDYYVNTKSKKASTPRTSPNHQGSFHQANMYICSPGSADKASRMPQPNHLPLRDTPKKRPSPTLEQDDVLDLTQDFVDTTDSSEIEFVAANRRKRRRTVQETAAEVELREDRTRVSQQEAARDILMDSFNQINSSQHNAIDNVPQYPVNTMPPIQLLDPHIARRVKPHQVTGIQFLWREVIENDKKQGCLLAHTMGLGKTMQVISFLITLVSTTKDLDSRHLVHPGLRKLKVLIMCPASLVDNWFDEFAIWTPNANYSRDTGELQTGLGKIFKVSGSSKKQVYRRWVNASSGVLLVSYESLRKFVNDATKDNETQDLQERLLSDASIVIADEAHKLKNAKSSISALAARFKTTSRIALTGSPLNNHLREYHTMIDWVAPGYLGTLGEFQEKYINPIEQGLYAESTRYEKRKSLEKLYVLKRDIAPKIDRKDISAIAVDMPQKTEFYITVPLTKMQVEFYNILVRTILDSHASLLGNTSSGLVKKSGNAQLWSWLSILSWLCNHPYCLLSKLREKDDSFHDLRAAARALNDNDEDEDLPENINISNSDLTSLLPIFLACAKNKYKVDVSDEASLLHPAHSMRSLITMNLLLEASRNGEKTLLFSHSIPTLDYLERMLQTQNISYTRIDGSTTVHKRQGLTKTFNSAASSISVFLISTRAGGLGLNLQGASRVIIYDFGFNPSWEEQAIGRAYRLGQKKPVFVYKFRAGGTFEDNIHNKSVYKKALFDRVVEDKNVVRHATSKAADYLFPVRETLQGELSALEKDPLLHSVHDALPGSIRTLELTETFQIEDKEDQLDAEEEKRAEEQYQLEQLRRSGNLVAANAREAELRARDLQEAIHQGVRSDLAEASLRPPPFSGNPFVVPRGAEAKSMLEMLGIMNQKPVEVQSDESVEYNRMRETSGVKRFFEESHAVRRSEQRRDSENHEAGAHIDTIGDRTDDADVTMGDGI